MVNFVEGFGKIKVYGVCVIAFEEIFKDNVYVSEELG